RIGVGRQDVYLALRPGARQRRQIDDDRVRNGTICQVAEFLDKLKSVWSLKGAGAFAGKIVGGAERIAVEVGVKQQRHLPRLIIGNEDRREIGIRNRREPKNEQEDDDDHAEHDGEDAKRLPPPCLVLQQRLIAQRDALMPKVED